MELPKIVKIRQKFNTSRIEDIPAEVRKQLEAINIEDMAKPGMRIAVTAGSRGIANIALIIKTVCDILKEHGAEPFIVPAMGSHGGATAEGQVKVLAKLGITESTMEVPIISSMEVVEVGRTENGAPVYMDKNAFNADGIAVVNRVKPHTDFSGEIQSGLMKMMAVGLGKHAGCSTMHAYGLAKTIPAAARVDLQKAPILFGLGIVENSKDETYKIKAVLPAELEEQDKMMLRESMSMVPQLPVDDIDLLVVGKMGKMISGTGMDTKVIGRIRVEGEKESERPRIRRLVVLDLDDNSYGNALGVGLADITTRRLFDKIDFKATYANVIPTTYLERGKIPIIMDNDEEAVKTALSTIGRLDSAEARVIIIKNTLHLEEMFVSTKVLDEIKERPDIEVIGEIRPMSFDSLGCLNLDWEGQK